MAACALQKGKGGKGGGKAAGPEAPLDVSRLNLLVGTVVAVKQHEAADRRVLRLPPALWWP